MRTLGSVAIPSQGHEMARSEKQSPAELSASWPTTPHPTTFKSLTGIDALPQPSGASPIDEP